MDGQTVEVIENNKKFGSQQIEKNVDLKIQKARKSIFSLLGAGFAFKSSLCPAVKLYLYRTYSSPILRSGLSTLAIRKGQMEPLANFQRKILKSCVKVSKFALTPAIHFLIGELPIEGQIHQDVFSLFLCDG